uniref:Oligodendrocyte myelin glycoprotein b n=1 Tax=Poecilia mexicana TaxID=48701 RepID=A0A3B3YRS6_9TELE
RGLTMLTSSLFLVLLCGLLGGWVLSVCPSVCSCSGGHRDVDCSFKSLTKLPHGLQHNIPAWNRLRSLDKKDTAYHWNLKLLDLSHNELDRIVFINNTLLSVTFLNLSHNRFWTVPTNMPHNLEIIDLSFNYLVQILPGSLDRLPKLVKLYLHANHFSVLPEGIFDKLRALKTITLGDNPWACEEEDNITRILRWAEQTPATVLGCPYYDGMSTARTVVVTSAYETIPSQHKTGLGMWTSSTGFHSVSKLTSTTEHLLSSTVKPKMANSRSKSQKVFAQIEMVLLNIFVPTIAFNTTLPLCLHVDVSRNTHMKIQTYLQKP